MTKEFITWIKPNGNELKTNAEKGTVEHCESLGWKRKDAKQESKQDDKKAVNANA